MKRKGNLLPFFFPFLLSFSGREEPDRRLDPRDNDMSGEISQISSVIFLIYTIDVRTHKRSTLTDLLDWYLYLIDTLIVPSYYAKDDEKMQFGIYHSQICQ